MLRGIITVVGELTCLLVSPSSVNLNINQMLENCLARTVITHLIHSLGPLLRRNNISGVSSSPFLPLPPTASF